MQTKRRKIRYGCICFYVHSYRFRKGFERNLFSKFKKRTELSERLIKLIKMSLNAKPSNFISQKQFEGNIEIEKLNEKRLNL